PGSKIAFAWTRTCERRVTAGPAYEARHADGAAASGRRRSVWPQLRRDPRSRHQNLAREDRTLLRHATQTDLRGSRHPCRGHGLLGSTDRTTAVSWLGARATNPDACV